MSEIPTSPLTNVGRRQFPWPIAPAICAMILGIVWVLSGWLAYGSVYYMPIVAVLILASLALGIVQSRSMCTSRRILAGVGSCGLTVFVLVLVFGMSLAWYAAEAARFPRPEGAHNIDVEVVSLRWEEIPIMWSVSCETALSREQIEQFYQEHLTVAGADWKMLTYGTPSQSTITITEDERWIFITIMDMEAIYETNHISGARPYRFVTIHSQSRDDLSSPIGKLSKSIGRWW